MTSPAKSLQDHQTPFKASEIRSPTISWRGTPRQAGGANGLALRQPTGTRS